MNIHFRPSDELIFHDTFGILGISDNSIGFLLESTLVFYVYVKHYGSNSALDIHVQLELISIGISFVYLR